MLFWIEITEIEYFKMKREDKMEWRLNGKEVDKLKVGRKGFICKEMKNWSLLLIVYIKVGNINSRYRYDALNSGVII